MGKRTKYDSRQLRLPLGKPGAVEAARASSESAPPPSKSAKVFVSYTSTDQHAADHFIAALNGIEVEHWAFRDRMDGSATWPAQIISALNQSTNFIVCLSRAGAASKHVLREMHIAMEYDLPVHAFIENKEFLLPDHEYILAGEQHFPLYPLSDLDRQVRLALASEPPENHARRREKWIARSRRQFSDNLER